jgi:hypothetical protein
MTRSSRFSRLPRMTHTVRNIVWPVVALALAAGILVGSAAAGSPSSSPTPSSSPVPVPSSTAVASPDASVAPAWLSAMAANLASENASSQTSAVDTPVTSQWALCSVRQAAQLMGSDADEVPSDIVGQQCYVIVMKGQFTANNASMPNGRPAPEGNVLVCVVDPTTHKVLGFCLWPVDLKVDTSSVSTLAPLSPTAN